MIGNKITDWNLEQTQYKTLQLCSNSPNTAILPSVLRPHLPLHSLYIGFYFAIKHLQMMDLIDK